jgi:hypothetical protein
MLLPNSKKQTLAAAAAAAASAAPVDDLSPTSVVPKVSACEEVIEVSIF